MSSELATMPLFRILPLPANPTQERTPEWSSGSEQVSKVGLAPEATILPLASWTIGTFRRFKDLQLLVRVCTDMQRAGDHEKNNVTVGKVGLRPFLAPSAILYCESIYLLRTGLEPAHPFGYQPLRLSEAN